MFIDVNAWAGPWPMLVNVPYDAASVRNSLRAYGVERINMAPLAAAWCTNPHICNPVVYTASDEYDDISPVPILDPTLPTWPKELEKAAGHSAVRMIKLLPSYGGYALAAAEDLLVETCQAGLAVMVQVRIEDPRRHHPLAMVPDLPAGDIVEAAERHPDLKLVIGGASTATLRNLAARWRALQGLFAETSQVDGMDSVKMLVDEGLVDRLLFGSHAPVFMPAAAAPRVLNDLPDDAALAIMRDNAAKLLMG